MEFHEHALQCGINMEGREAIPIHLSNCRIAATDILHPETQELIIPAGFRLRENAYLWMESVGMDYVVVEA